jgi:AcrR family transcriptional regulator
MSEKSLQRMKTSKPVPAGEPRRRSGGAMATTRRLGRPSLGEADAITQNILDAALQEFCRAGFAGASIEKIASVANVTRNALYRRYSGKEALFSCVIERQITTLEGRLDNIRRASGDPLMALHKTARAYLDLMLSPSALDLQRIVIAEARRFPGLAELGGLPGTLARRLEALVEAAQNAGQLLPADPALWREVLLTLIAMGPRWPALVGVKPWSSRRLDQHVAKMWPIFMKIAGTDEAAK